MRHEDMQDSEPRDSVPQSSTQKEINVGRGTGEGRETAPTTSQVSSSATGLRADSAAPKQLSEFFHTCTWVGERVADRYERVNWSWTSRIVTGLIVLLVGGASVAFASLVGVVFSDLDAKKNWFDWGVWKSHWYILAPAVPATVGLLWRRYIKNLEVDKNALYREVRLFYERMGFQNDLDADIRCTLWMPSRNYKSGLPTWLTQATDYYPITSPLPGPRHQHRQNRGAGRSYKVYRRAGDRIETEGIIGWCAVDSVHEQGSDDYIISVPEDKGLVECLVNDFNYTPRHAKRVTSDRLSFMCVALLNRGSTKLLGVLYCDSRKRNTFDRNLSVKAESFLRDVVNAMDAD